MASLTGSIVAASVVLAPDGTEHMQLVIDVDASGDTVAIAENSGRPTLGSPRTPTNTVGTAITVTTTSNEISGIAFTE